MNGGTGVRGRYCYVLQCKHKIRIFAAGKFYQLDLCKCKCLTPVLYDATAMIREKSENESADVDPECNNKPMKEM